MITKIDIAVGGTTGDYEINPEVSAYTYGTGTYISLLVYDDVYFNTNSQWENKTGVELGKATYTNMDVNDYVNEKIYNMLAAQRGPLKIDTTVRVQDMNNATKIVSYLLAHVDEIADQIIYATPLYGTYIEVTNFVMDICSMFLENRELWPQEVREDPAQLYSVRSVVDAHWYWSIINGKYVSDPDYVDEREPEIYWVITGGRERKPEEDVLVEEYYIAYKNIYHGGAKDGQITYTYYKVQKYTNPIYPSTYTLNFYTIVNPQGILQPIV